MSRTPQLGRRFVPVLAFILSIMAARASGATTWSSDFNISGSDVNVSLTPLNSQRFTAVDDSNNLYIAFFDDRNKIIGGDDNYEIYFRRFTFQLGSPSLTRVTNSSGMSKYPSLTTLNWGAGDAATVNDSGRVYIAWQDARLFPIPSPGVEPKSYTIFFKTYQSLGGVGFGPEIQVSAFDSTNAATAPVVAVDPSEQVWIVWQKSDVSANRELHYAVYNALTRTMGSEQLLTSGAVSPSNPSIAVDRNGLVQVVWVDSRTGAQQIWTKKYVPGSGWTADAQLVFSPTISNAPYITSNYPGHFHLVWKDLRDGNYEIYYKEYSPGTGWDPADTRLTTNSAAQTEPQVESDTGNSAYVVWTDARNGSSNTDIFYMERHAGVWAPEFSLVGAATDTTNQRQYGAGITHDGMNNLYVAWTDERLPATSGRNKDIYYKVGTAGVTGVDGSPVPGVTRLLRNYPNPFNPATKIEFSLDRDAQVLLRIYDVHGRLVRTLVDSYLAAGRRVVEWDGRGDKGEALASGAYFMKLSGGGQFLARTVNLVK